MTEICAGSTAFGSPGLPPHWTDGAKTGVGTSYNSVSRIWFTLSGGIITEVYYPTIDKPQIRDMQFLVTDGKTFFQGEQSLFTEIRQLSEHSLGYRITNSDPDGRYALIKEIIADPSTPCVLQHVDLKGAPDFLESLKVYAYVSPHLGVGGWGNNGHIVESAGRKLLAASKNGIWMVIGANISFSRLSCGYSGSSDGWTDLSENFIMDWEFSSAPEGNIALTAELDLKGGTNFTIGLALGDSLQNAITNLFHSLALPFDSRQKRYRQQWERQGRQLLPLGNNSKDGGKLYSASTSLLAAHEDKTYPGAFIASLSIPWGETLGDNAVGGYHLVWTRDMVNSVSGLLAAGDTEAARRSLIFLAASQQPDGGFPQNFWLDGRPYWQGIQLDEVAFPIVLAWKLKRMGITSELDDYEMVLRAASYLVRHGPSTAQDRWEEVSGYSPSTLAINIAALICAAGFAREHGDELTAKFLEEYADFLECHIEKWTVTTQGALVEGISRHYVRVNPVSPDDFSPSEQLNDAMLVLPNQPPGQPFEYKARGIVDAGFLELVRYGVRPSGDPLVEDSLKVIDAVLKRQTPFGPVWRRYNHDGYGQRPDGAPYIGWGEGQGWPLLTAERGMYELAAGRDITVYLKALEGFASYTGLLPEQVWDGKDNPEAKLFLGRPTGAAMPLMWAHAEYIKLLRSITDHRVFDLIPEVADRYLGEPSNHKFIEIWKFNRQPRRIQAGQLLRIQAPDAFRLVWTPDDWKTVNTTGSEPTRLGVHYVDLPAAPEQQRAVIFTFFRLNDERWEGRNYEIAIN